MRRVTVWSVIGVDEDNWWNEYAPGKDCMEEFAVIVVGAGVLGRSSLLDSQIVENFERSTQQQTTREVVQKLARKAAYWVAQVIVEVPPEAQLRKYT